MGIYTVHIKGSSDEPSAYERAVFVREGFGWWAFIFGPLWLLWNRAWLALLIWTCLQFGLALLVQNQILHVGAQSLLELILALALGFEAATLRRYVLRRRGFRMIDVVQERRLADAERRFFARVEMPHHTPSSHHGMAPGTPGLVGLFPSAGA